MLEQYRPSILASLKFSKLTLGTVAPQFTGVSIMDCTDDNPGEVVMELDLQWDGNPNIVLDIKTKVGVSIPIQVKNIGFTGVFRLMFKPLVDEFPCFGAVCYSLREKKNLDFTLKVVGGDISAIPGIADALESTIKDAIEDSITWPVRKIIPLLPGDYSYLESKPVGTLEVKLIEAKELTNKDFIGKSDPFAKLFIRPLRGTTKTSKTINNNTNPIWNAHFEFTVEDISTQHLTVRVYDDEGVQASEFIGCGRVALSDLDPGKVKDVWLKLVKDVEFPKDQKNRGQVHLELLYIPLSSRSSYLNPYDPDFRLTSFEKTLKQGSGTDGGDDSRKDVIMRGVVSVTVISAQDLPATDIMGKSDPFVVLIMKKSEQKYKTRVLNDTLNPVWNQTFDFVVENGLHELLMLEVYDHDTFGKDSMQCPSHAFTLCACDPGYLYNFSGNSCHLFVAGDVSSGVSYDFSLPSPGTIFSFDSIKKFTQSQAVFLEATLVMLLSWLAFCLLLRLAPRGCDGRSHWFKMPFWTSHSPQDTGLMTRSQSASARLSLVALSPSPVGYCLLACLLCEYYEICICFPSPLRLEFGIVNHHCSGLLVTLPNRLKEKCRSA